LAVFKYPKSTPVPASGNDADGPTEAIDYLAIRRSRIRYEDSQGKYYGENLPNNKVQRDYHPHACYVAMPPQLSTSYNPAYSRTDVGVAGVMAASLAGGDMDGSDMTRIAQSVQAAAQGGSPEFAASLIASAANGLNNMLGLAGNTSASSLLALSKGKVFNPFTEQVFNSMAFRTHTFNFKFLSRNEAEAHEVKAIIDYIKIGSGPIISSGNAIDEITLNQSKSFKSAIDQIKEATDFTDSSISDDVSDFLGSDTNGFVPKYRYMEVPDKYHLKIMRLNPDQTQLDRGDGQHGLHFRMHTSVCTGINVNYTPDGQYTTFKRFGHANSVQVPALQMTVSFTETRMVTQRDMINGY